MIALHAVLSASSKEVTDFTQENAFIISARSFLCDLCVEDQNHQIP